MEQSNAATQAAIIALGYHLIANTSRQIHENYDIEKGLMNYDKDNVPLLHNLEAERSEIFHRRLFQVFLSFLAIVVYCYVYLTVEDLPWHQVLWARILGGLNTLLFIAIVVLKDDKGWRTSQSIYDE